MLRVNFTTVKHSIYETISLILICNKKIIKSKIGRGIPLFIVYSLVSTVRYILLVNIDFAICKTLLYLATLKSTINH